MTLVTLAALIGCSGDPPAERQPLPVDTGTASVFTKDTADFLPVDTGTTDPGTEDNVPDNLLTVSQSGIWSLAPIGGPFTDLSGVLLVQEYVDELDPKLPEYACEVEFNLTGQSVDEHTCSSCDFVFDVTHFITKGETTGCREPDTPQHEDVWQMGYDSNQGALVHNYGGSDVWVRWADADLQGTDLSFTFDLVMAIQVEEEETDE